LGAERGGIRPIRLSDFVSQSPAMHTFMETVYRVVSADNSLLILGETGVGKEHLARAIHSESPRASGSFIAVNCGALPETLLESELFGHEKGAFTGADRAVRGQFEMAHRGTIFLDEIGEMPLHLQVKLLHVLERRQIRRVGGEQSIAVDVRVIAATNRNLTAEVEAGRFRRDLFYRLGAVVLTIPPLRDRREDIPELAENYLQYFRVNTGQPIKGLDADAMAALVKHSWPGNVRELINVMERAVLLCRGDTIRPVDLPSPIAEAPVAAVVVAGVAGSVASVPPLPPVWLDKPLRVARRMAMDNLERLYLTQLLTQTRGRIGETARRAGMTTRSLYDRMRRLGLRKEDFRGRTVSAAATDEDDPDDPVQVPAA
jgi:DNA-binding NtrC family response regulator